ncbi:hypothetical protein V496_03734 [Pseudogymnoascus sp. VKM F-4515 (FW-2607)]|nr:hypothetical protein V496_03734 [Pseudogymnoascus sp. VKM F-4515 (FW-2607)]
MHFITALIASAFTALAAAQSTAANPFTNSDYSAISAGQAFTITWSPTTTGPISLVLVKGDPTALTTVSTIASGLDNSGSFTWTPDSSIAKGSDYALKIVDDADDTIVNYTLQFPIDSAGTASSADTSVVASSTISDTTNTEGTAPHTTTSTADASTESAAPDITTNTAEASPTNDSTKESSTTLATISTPDADTSSSAFSAPENNASATTSPSSTTSEASVPSAVSESSSSGAAAANVCAGLMGLVGATVLLL